MRLCNGEIRQLSNGSGISGRVIGSDDLAATRNIGCIGDTGGSVVGDVDRDSDWGITDTGSKCVAAGTGERAEHAEPRGTAADVGGSEARGQGVGDGYSAIRGRCAGVGNGD